MKSKIVAVLNPKNEVGKTTTAINFSASLSVLESRVLLVDLDPSANASRNMGFYASDIEKGAGEVFQYGELSKDFILKTELEYLEVIPSSEGLVGFEVESYVQGGKPFRFRDVLHNFEHACQYLILDCPPSYTGINISALIAADYVLIPVKSGPLDINAMQQLLNMIEIVRRRYNSQLKIVGVIITMTDLRDLTTGGLEKEIRSFFGELVLKTTIPNNAKFSESSENGKPIVLYDVKSIGTQVYLELAHEVLKRFKI